MRARLTLALCLAAAMPAAAQPAGEEARGDEYREGYRKGYDDGFASGYRKAQEEAARAPAAPVYVTPAPAPPPPAPPPPPRATGPITVSTAFYGTSSKSCDATHKIARSANGRRTFSMNVTNELCGDPAKGARKSLEVTYVCGTIAKTASAYEHRTISLDCTP